LGIYENIQPLVEFQHGSAFYFAISDKIRKTSAKKIEATFFE
jgi:hypothetical protein